MPAAGSRVAWTVALVAVGVGAWLAGSWSGRPRPPTDSDAASATGESSARRSASRGAGDRLDAHPSDDEGDPGEMSLLLATTEPAEAECTEKCPPALRVEGGEEGRTRLREILASLDPALRALARHPRTPAPFRAALERRLRVHEAQAAPGASGTFRVLATEDGRPELGAGSAMVTKTLYDHTDPVFDQKRPPWAGGGRLMIARHERAGDGAIPRLVEGVIEIGETGRPWIAPTGFPTPEASRVRTPAMGHFYASGTVSALYLDERGRLHVIGSGERSEILDADSSLVEAVRRVLLGA